MEAPYAEATCVLKVNVHCQACKMRMMEVLGSICGMYNVDIDADKGLVVVYAVVDPNLLFRALARTGYHAELKWVKLRHPNSHRGYYNSDYGSHNYGYGYGHGSLDYPYRYGWDLSNGSWYDGLLSNHYSPRRILSPSYRGLGPYFHGSGLPPARYVPSYPPKEYDPYTDDEPISFCSIM